MESPRPLPSAAQPPRSDTSTPYDHGFRWPLDGADSPVRCPSLTVVSSPACGSLPPSSSLSVVAYVACREDRSAFVSTPTSRTDLPPEELLGEAGGGERCRETANYSPDSLGLRVATRALSPRLPDKTLWPDDGSVSLKSPRAQSETPRAKTPKTPNTGELTAMFDRAYENPAGDTLETRDFAELPSDNAGDASQRGRERECVDP